MLTHARGLTVRQPWAQAIAAGEKVIENRSQAFPKSHRGMLLIHAGAEWSKRGREDPRILDWGRRVGGDILHVLHYGPRWAGPQGRGIDNPRMPEAFPMRAVIAVADVVDVHPAAGCCAPWGEETYEPSNREQRPPGRVTHLVLERVTKIDPIRTNGALGLWRPDDDLILEVAHRLAELVTWDLEAARRVAERGGDYDADYLWAALGPDG